MTKLKVAVIGTGYLGEFHAQKYAQIDSVDLVAIVDTNIERCQALAATLHTKAVEDYRELIGKVDAVSIVTPTSTHFAIGKFFLENGIHVLMEKPITTTVEEADILISLAKSKNCLLQVGYLERFNPILNHVEGKIKQVQFIESTRIAPFNPRNKDVNVVLDLMIHDIDLIQHLVNAPIERIDANGACVLTQEIDIANARILFANGCVANVTASRISLKPERKMRIFQHDAYISLDLQNKQVSICTRGQGEMFPGIPTIEREEHTITQSDALLEEIKAFVNAILNKTPVLVTGEDGKIALQTALEITRLVKAGVFA
ncbi:MAG: Gfo/Idh/MocA family oxidoreductase [Gammaproteobacteria bacterium]|nr:Gfo/Idh/MocA family oxidoreductase [Gammaproteobacteria bacterium]